MIKILKKHYIGKGHNRQCFHHPDNQNLCIKINIGNETKDSDKEIAYYKKLVKKDITKFDYPFFANYLGPIQTNLGIGHVYDLVVDEQSHQVSKTLKYYIDTKPAIIDYKILITALSRLKQQMIQHRVFVSGLYARNICCKILQDYSIELVIIDGLRNKEMIPLADYISYLARKKIERHFLRSKLEPLSDNYRD